MCAISYSATKTFCKNATPKNFSKWTGKDQCWSILFNKVAGPMPAMVLQKRLKDTCFPVNFAKKLGTPFFPRTPPVAAMEKTFAELSFN